MRKRLFPLFCCTLFVVFVLTACDDGTSPPAKNATPPSKKVQPVQTAVSETDEAKDQVYTYNPTGTRDPFENPFSLIVEIPIDNEIPLTPLQKLDLNQLRLIGLIIGKGSPAAMVIAPDGKSFILKKGVKVGRNNGVVADITTEAVIVEEQYLDFAGDTKKRIQNIKLPKREE
ncbi:MAG: pilus assembly protein PilP [Desulfuromonadales bacterium]|nr:pilus assembly protein PilP [Desulfuromonadales bacterium]